MKAGRNVVSTTPIAKAGSCHGTPSLAVVLQAFMAIGLALALRPIPLPPEVKALIVLRVESQGRTLWSGF